MTIRHFQSSMTTRDHMRVVDASAGLEQSAFRRRLSLDERCWVKITKFAKPVPVAVQ
jgi:hypothetical protein